MIEGVVLAVMSFVFFLIVMGALFHFKPPKERWKTVSRLAFFFLMMYTFLLWLFPFRNWLYLLNPASPYAMFFAYINGALIYIFLFLSFGQFYFLVDRGVSARILIELFQANGQHMDEREIAKNYTLHDMQSRRIDDMVYGKYVIRDGSSVGLTPKGMIMAKIFLSSKKLLRLYPGG